ncbi:MULTISPECIES: hypothetical protein [unclassified Rhodococcus (in: high G+C Gram-positive bacteria)]|uniref:hypothetical protein n=1 Tax=unclassified Rhodococcus (in: high G+C Gram-positive bacteria) TaxID=192944 RepID=UPI00207855F7|nr:MULTISPECIES: hypothetical protein [unclassified Rhodococcus (in: high G+C Gram-positive bacteria)]
MRFQSERRVAGRRPLRAGLAGAVGIVIAQAAGRDLYSRGKLVRYYGRPHVVADS